MGSTKKDLAIVSMSEELRTDALDQNMVKDLDEPGAIPAKYRGTAHDKREMSIMGKKQVLRVSALANLISLAYAHLLTCAAKL
jgi:hypothetical protein